MSPQITDTDVDKAIEELINGPAGGDDDTSGAGGDDDNKSTKGDDKGGADEDQHGDDDETGTSEDDDDASDETGTSGDDTQALLRGAGLDKHFKSVKDALASYKSLNKELENLRRSSANENRANAAYTKALETRLEFLESRLESPTGSDDNKDTTDADEYTEDQFRADFEKDAFSAFRKAARKFGFVDKAEIEKINAKGAGERAVRDRAQAMIDTVGRYPELKSVEEAFLAERMPQPGENKVWDALKLLYEEVYGKNDTAPAHTRIPVLMKMLRQRIKTDRPGPKPEKKLTPEQQKANTSGGGNSKGKAPTLSNGDPDFSRMSAAEIKAWHMKSGRYDS
jgi:hypothetical protein